MPLFTRDSDTEWENRSVTIRENIPVVYCVSNYHKLVLRRTTNVEPIKPDPLTKNALMTACNRMNVDFPGMTLEMRLSYEITRVPTSLYMTGYFDANSKSRLMLKGQEAWIVEIFVEKLVLETKNMTLFPVYLFSEDLKCWCQLNNKYKWVYIKRPEKPSGNYIGISSEPVSSTAKLEISLL